MSAQPSEKNPPEANPPEEDPATGPEPQPAPGEQAPLAPVYHGPREALLLLALCFGLHAAVGQLHHVGAWAADLTAALAVLVWILPPYLVLQRRGEDPWLRHALTSRPRGLGPAIALSLGILILFVAGAWALGPGSAEAPKWADLARALPYQVVFVALKEEYFFRGVLQPALEAEGGPPRRLLGAPFGRGAVAAAALFALAHLWPDPNPARLLTFFPALWFAWLRARTGSLWPAIAAHAAANLVGQACFQAFGAGPF